MVEDLCEYVIIIHKGKNNFTDQINQGYKSNRILHKEYNLKKKRYFSYEGDQIYRIFVLILYIGVTTNRILFIEKK